MAARRTLRNNTATLLLQVARARASLNSQRTFVRSGASERVVALWKRRRAGARGRFGPSFCCLRLQLAATTTTKKRHIKRIQQKTRVTISYEQLRPSRAFSSLPPLALACFCARFNLEFVVFRQAQRTTHERIEYFSCTYATKSETASIIA